MANSATIAGAMRTFLHCMRYSLARAVTACVIVAVMTSLGYTLRHAPLLPTHFIPNSASGVKMDAVSAYPIIFAAQERGDFAAADVLIAQLSDTTLLGYVLAQRYQSAHYRPTANELVAWLTNYSDHPQAQAMLTLAQQTGATPESLQHISLSKETPLRGEGYAAQIGRSAMPNQWYTGLRYWKEGKYFQAAAYFNSVARDERLNPWQRSAAAFWAYRAYNKVGNVWEGIRALNIAASFPDTFYGMLANAKNGKPLEMKAALPPVSEAMWNDRAIRRARLLAALDRTNDAEAELRLRYRTLGDDYRPALVTVAATLNLPNLQLRMSQTKGLTPSQSLAARFPMPKAMVEAQNTVDPALILAVARNESAFRETAYNPSGAQGMMQILPSTAKHVLEASNDISLVLADNGSGANLSIHERLNDMTMSAKLGGAYFTMLEKEPAVGNNLMRLLAAYNAGPGTVANWQKTAKNIDDPLLYLESIPYMETHNYVLQVMAHYWVYQSLMGKTPTSLKQLAADQWPTA